MPSIASSIVGTVSTETLQTYKVENITLTLANTEYTHTLPLGTKNFCFQNRNDATVKFKSDPSGDFWTFFPGQPYPIENLKSSATITIILEATKPNQIIEIISWR